MKITLTNDDGSTVDFLDQASVDAQIAAAAPASTPVVEPTDTEVDLVLSDGTTKKFVPAQ